jgi:hypothetical protein
MECFCFDNCLYAYACYKNFSSKWIERIKERRITL